MHPSVYKRPLLWTLVGWVVALALFYHPAPGKRDVFHFLPQQEVTLVGRVESFPVVKNQKQNVWLKVISVNSQPASGRVYTRLSDFSAGWKDTLQISGRLQAPYSVHLPGSFDWKNYLANKQIFTELKPNTVTVVKQASWPWRIIRQVRQHILHVLNTSFPPSIAGIAGGVMLGERGDFAPDLYTAFQDSGAIHLLVASGGNVGFITLLTLAVGFGLGLRRKQLVWVTLVTAGIYTLIAGADAPLLRAYLMAVCACVGYFLGRNSGVFQGLILSGLIILCITPSAVFETGFEMSFLATLFIIIFLNNYRISSSWPASLRFFAQIFLATLASQLALLPIFTNVFYKVSLTGLLSNMLLVPLASGLLGLGFAYYALSVVHLGIILYFPCLWGFGLFEVLVKFFASFRFSAMPVTAWSAGSIGAYYVLLFWVSQLPHKAFAKRLAVPCLLLAVVAFGWGRILQNRPAAYLLNEWAHRAVIVRINRTTAAVFNDGLNEDKIQRALYALGMRDATVSLPLSGPELFTQIWPGDEFPVGSARVRATWPLYQTKQGRVFEEAGYSGRKNEGISYCVYAKNREICMGARGRFLLPNAQQAIAYKQNDTVRTAW